MNGPNSLRLTPELLARPAALAVRVVADARLEACLDALEQLDTDAPEALHDVRVSLRRLRSWLRTFRPYVDDTVRPKRHRQLRRLVRATNSARDLQVWSAWVADLPDAGRPTRAGARYVIERLTRELGDTGVDDVARVQQRLPRIAKSLRAELATYSLRLRGGLATGDTRMSEATADALRDGCSRLWRRIAQIESESDVAAIHRTRIAAKRLRYLVETLDTRAEATEVATAMTELQDQLGIVHDMQLLVTRLVEEIASAGAASAKRRAAAKLGPLAGDGAARVPAGVIAGMTDLALRAQRRAHDAFEEFGKAWDERGVKRIDDMVGGIAEELDAS